MSASIDVELQVACASDTVPRREEISTWIEDTIALADPRRAGAIGIVVRIVDERESQALNYRYRRRNRPTNVLAFPAAGPEELPGLPPEAITPLGDLAICAPVLEREAREQGKPASAHWAHLLVHGTLHLLGYDHQSAEQAAGMEGLETRILSARGVADPYA